MPFPPAKCKNKLFVGQATAKLEGKGREGAGGEGSASRKKRGSSALTSERCEDVDEGVLRMLLAKMCPKAKPTKFKENEHKEQMKKAPQARRAMWPRLGWSGLVWPRPKTAAAAAGSGAGSGLGSTEA